MGYVRQRHKVGGNAPHVARRHGNYDGRGSHGGFFDPTQPTDGLYGSVIDREATMWTDMSGAFVGEGNVQDGVITADTFDTTPPAPPTSIAWTSLEEVGSDGGIHVVAHVTWVDPADTDLYGVFMVVYEDDGTGLAADPDTGRSFFAEAGAQMTTISGLRGATQFWLSGYAVDRQGNASLSTTLVAVAAIGDTVAPSVPLGPQATAGFRGAIFSWQSVIDGDLSTYDIRYAVDIGTGLAPSLVWTEIRARTTVIWISGLVPGVRYWFQVRAVDRSGNASAWTADVLASTSCVPTQVGAADIAAHSITSEMITTSGLSADVILTGVLAVGTVTGIADGITVHDAGATTPDKMVGRWDEGGLRIYSSTDMSDYILIDEGSLTVYKDGVAVTALTTTGIDASAIRFGTLAGGHNLIPNSSFEIGAFSAEVSVGDISFTLSSQSRTSKSGAVITIDSGAW